MIANTHFYTVDLGSGTLETRWDTPLTYGDKNADTVQVTLTRGGVPATLSTPTAILYGVNADGLTAFKTATIVDNIVTATMDETFYAVPGKLDLLLQVSEGTDATHTPLRISASVKPGITDELVSTGEELSLAALEAIVSAAQTATTNANNSAAAADAAAEAALEAAQQTVGSLPADNLVLNPTFATATNWSAGNATLSFADNVMTILGGASTSIYARQNSVFVPSSTDLMFVWGEVMVSNGNCTLIRVGAPSALYASISNPIANRWYKVAYIGNNPTEAYFYVRQYYNDAVAGREMKVRNVGAINLTQKLGVGNEPGLSVMDYRMSKWPNRTFIGTANVAQADKLYLEIADMIRDISERGIAGIVSGMTVTAKATPDMSVAVAAGVVVNEYGRRYSVAALSSQAITAANATNPRIDIVYADVYGVAAYLAGTAAATPVVPSVPAGGVLCATIRVAAGITSITSADITMGAVGTGKAKFEALTARVAALEAVDTSYVSSLYADCQSPANRNMYDPALALDGKYVSYVNGTYADSANYATSGKVRVVPGKTYTLSAPDSTYTLAIGQSLRAYSAAGAYLGVAPAVSGYTTAPGLTVTALADVRGRRQMRIAVASNSGIAYIEFTIINNVAHTTAEFDAHKVLIQMEESANVTLYQAHAPAVLPAEAIDVLRRSNVLYGKVLATVGDSITYGGDMDAAGIDADGNLLTYGKLIAHRNDMPFYNLGISGSTMQDIVAHNGFSNAARYQALPAVLDYLTIWFGWNDAAYGTLGTIADTDPTASFYGAWNTVLPWLIQNYPTTKIGLIVPFVASAGHRSAVRAVGNKWGLPYLDLYAANTPFFYGKEDSVGVDSQVPTWRRAVFQANGAHPGSIGHAYLSTMVDNFLRSL